MLDFICMGSTELFETGWDSKIQNENICLQRDLNPRHATSRPVTQRFRPLGHADLISIGVFIDLQYPDIWIQMDMWQCMYGIGYALIANAKFCKQLLY